VNITFCDGPIGFIKDGIGLTVWWAIIGRVRAAVVSPDSY
jgi:hypothetical protein